MGSGEIGLRAGGQRLHTQGRAGARAVQRGPGIGQDVAAGAVLVKIDNPETIAKHEQALAAKIVAEAQLANINAGTREEREIAMANVQKAVADIILRFRCNLVRRYIVDQRVCHAPRSSRHGALAFVQRVGRLVESGWDIPLALRRENDDRSS